MRVRWYFNLGGTGSYSACGCSEISRLWGGADLGRCRHLAVNACLAPLVSVDGKHVITVEALGTSENPHPLQVSPAPANCSLTPELIGLQERLWKLSGSQCGFCTPGIVRPLTGSSQSCLNPRSCCRSCLFMLCAASPLRQTSVTEVWCSGSADSETLQQRDRSASPISSLRVLSMGIFAGKLSHSPLRELR